MCFGASNVYDKTFSSNQHKRKLKQKICTWSRLLCEISVKKTPFSCTRLSIFSPLWKVLLERWWVYILKIETDRLFYLRIMFWVCRNCALWCDVQRKIQQQGPLLVIYCLYITWITSSSSWIFVFLSYGRDNQLKIDYKISANVLLNNWTCFVFANWPSKKLKE